MTAPGAGGAAWGGGVAAHVAAYPPAVTIGLEGAAVEIASGTSPALAGVTSPSIRVTQRSAGESAATASAASSAAPQSIESTGVPPSSSWAHGVGPGATPSAPLGHAEAKLVASVRVAYAAAAHADGSAAVSP